MWKCHKCGKPVYFAERKQSLGYSWHPECLRCEECGKRLDPGQHAEHKGVPYCHVPCYGALFGPQLFGHGTRVESHTSFGKVENRSGVSSLPRTQLESKLKIFNQYYGEGSGKVLCREVNGRLVLEGALRIYWGVVGVIHFKEEYDQRTVVTVRKRNSYRNGVSPVPAENGCVQDVEGDSASCSSTPHSSPEHTPQVEAQEECLIIPDSQFEYRSSTLPAKFDINSYEWDALNELLQVERPNEEREKQYQTMPVGFRSSVNPELSETYSQLTIMESPKEELPHIDIASAVEQGSEGLNGVSGSNTCSDQDQETTPPEFAQLENEDTDSYSKDFEDNLEAEKRMSRSHSMPPEISGDIDFWGEEDLDDDVDIDIIGDHPLDRSISFPDSTSAVINPTADPCPEEAVPHRRKAAKTGSAAIRRRPGRRRSRTKLRRRCSINGHYYDRETSFFTPPHGSSLSVWVTSLVSTQEVVNLMLDKYRVDSKPDNFALFVVYDNGEQRRLREDEYPLITRVLLGPHEDVARIFIVDRQSTSEVSSEVAQFLNLSTVECSAILEGYRKEEERQINTLQEKYKELKKRIKQRMEELKVRL